MSDANDPLVRLCDDLFEFVCTRPVSAFVDRARLVHAIDTAATPERVTRAIARYAVPARERLLERLRQSQVLLGAWLPEPVREGIAAFLARPVHLPKQAVEELVATERVRDSVRTMMQEALSSVIQRGFQAAPGGRGLRGVMGLAGAAGRGLLGGLGDELQRKLEESVRDFVDSGVGLVQQRIVQRVTAEDTARQLGLRRAAVFRKILEHPESRVPELLKQVPFSLLEAMVPPVVAHNLARAEFRAAMTAEIDAVLADLERNTVGELLDELGLREAVRAWFHEQGAPLARAFLDWRAASQQT